MRLSFTARQIDELQLAYDVRLSVCPSQIFLLDDEGEDAVGTTRLLVHVVGGHDLVLDALPEVLEGVFDPGTLKDVDIFYRHLIRHWVHLQLEAVALTRFLVRSGQLR